MPTTYRGEGTDASSRRIARPVAALTYVLVVVGVIVADRKMRRWWQHASLLAGPVERVERAERRFNRRSEAVSGLSRLNRNLRSMR